MSRTTRELLITSATELLDEGDVAAVTLREVGRRAGVSHNAPYKHFRDKTALLATVAASELNRRLASRPAPRDLRELLYRYLDWAAGRPHSFRLVFGPWSIDSAELASAAEQAQAGLVALVRRAQADGVLPSAADPQRLGALVRATAHGAAELAAAGHLAADGKGRASPHDLVDDLLRYLERAADG